MLYSSILFLNQKLSLLLILYYCSSCFITNIAHLTDEHLLKTKIHYLHHLDIALVVLTLGDLKMPKKRVILKLSVYLNFSNVIDSYVNKLNSYNYRIKNLRYVDFYDILYIILLWADCHFMFHWFVNH